MNDRFINGPATRLFTDYGFKKIFGGGGHPQEPNKDLLMDSKEQAVYQESLKNYWDLKSAMETYFEKGRESRDVEIVLLIHSKNKPISKIAELTGLSEERVKEVTEKSA